MPIKTNLYSSSLRSHLTTKRFFLNIIYSIIISSFIGGFLTLVGIVQPFSVSFVLALSFGISTCSLNMLFLYIFNPKQENMLIIAAIILSSVAVGTILGFRLATTILRHLFSTALNVYQLGGNLQGTLLTLGISGTVMYFFYSKAQLRTTGEAIQEERINRLASEKETLESNLRLLQAQIEPHFLFNTLSNILSLLDTEPPKGKSMLMDLISFLRTSLSRTLPEKTTLNQEIDIIRAYLNIQKIRLGDRLHYTIELPETLWQCPFPPMLIQPLVENAIKHGLEPKITGGEINISVTDNNKSIRIEVGDTGMGLSSFNDIGVGIANVKERLRLIYDGKGVLQFNENKPTGVLAVIEVPKDDLQSHYCR